MRPLQLTLTASVLLAALRAQPTALSVNVASREEVRQFYRAVYAASEGVAMNWTGNYAAGAAGDTAAAFKEATRLRVNFYRALVGIPANITLDSTYSGKAQQAALMMSGNNQLQHTGIPPTWTYYTAAGAEAAANSNLALGSAGPDAVTGYIADGGNNNFGAGHRRWIFYPQIQKMGTGDVAGDGNQLRPANALWVFDSLTAPRPATRTTQVTYPPAGYIPYQLVWPRWSFGYPGADFSGATVTMTRGGQPVSVALQPLVTNEGEPSLVWVYDSDRLDTSLDPAPIHSKPAADTTYTVTVNNVRIGTGTQNFTYNVTVFDPAVSGADAVPTAVTGPAAPVVNAPNSYAVSKASFAAGFDWRSIQLAPFTQTFDAESGLEGLAASASSGYNVLQKATVGAGTSSYQLAHTGPSTQSLTLPGQYYVADATAAVTFLSRLGIATSIETAHVQVSTDDGANWTDVYSQSGTSPLTTGASTETTFVTRSVSLAAYAGRIVAVRFVYTIDGNGSYFVPSGNSPVGWFIDNAALTGVQTATIGSPTRMDSGTTFSFTPAATGSVGLQARGVLFSYPAEWGPVNVVTAAAATGAGPTARLSNLSVRTAMAAGQTLIVGLNVTEGSRDVLVRAVGPKLAEFGVPGAMTDPQIDVYSGSTKILSNDNWDSSLAPVFSSVGAFGLTTGSKDAALVRSLSGGNTIQARGTGPGVVLVEAYDIGTGFSPRLSNVSARNLVGTGDNILIAGFNIAGTGEKRLLIRGIGPQLGAFGVGGFLADPKLEVYDGNNVKVAENDNWDATLASTFDSVGAFALVTGSKDAAMVVTLKAGTSYTVQLKGSDGGTGEGLIEIYELP